MNTVDPQGKRASRKPLLVVAYYTKNTPYECEVENLRRSLDDLPLAYQIVGVQNLGSWQANTQYKAVFLKHMLSRHGSRHRLLYVDADAVFRRYPELLDHIECDVAVHARRRETLSGTIYLEPTPTTATLLETWISINHEHPGRWDQVNLAAAIRKCCDDTGLRAAQLPAEYTFIFDLSRHDHPTANPVIEHFQASRRFKRQIQPGNRGNDHAPRK